LYGFRYADPYSDLRIRDAQKLTDPTGIGIPVVRKFPKILMPVKVERIFQHNALI
jgi:hypothetical protein